MCLFCVFLFLNNIFTICFLSFKKTFCLDLFFSFSFPLFLFFRSFFLFFLFSSGLFSFSSFFHVFMFLLCSFPWSGVAFPPSSSFVGGVVVFPSPFAWCCLPSPPLGSGAFPLSSVGWCCLVSCSFLYFFQKQVVLLFFLLLLMVLPSFASRGLWCLSPLFCKAVLLGFLLPLEWCCCLSFSFCRCCLPSPPLGGGASLHLFCWVVLLGFFPLWVVCCCSPCFLLSPPLGCGAFSPVFCWVVLLPPHSFSVVLLFFLLLLVMLPSFASFGWGGVLPLFCWVVLLGLLLPWRCLSSPFT